MYWLVLMVQTGLAHKILVRLGGRARGQSTVEYALVGALVVIAAAGALTILGGQVTAVFSNISDTLRSAAGR
jgi:Flp pilus assembly pilin Flp